MTKSNKKYSVLALIGITMLSLALHFYRLDFPAQPVFDEVYFATEAADYVKQIPFEDIHPPLGKLIYAAALTFTNPRSLRDSEFIKVIYDDQTKTTKAITYPTKQYGDFPYIMLRTISAVFGVALPLVFYFFLRSLGVANLGSLIGALAVSLENAVLVDTRFILLNGMYLVFGILALTFYFKKNHWPIASGVMMGLALGVKLIAIVFLGPILIYHYLVYPDKNSKKTKKFSLVKFGTVALVIYFMIFNSTNLILSPDARYRVLSSYHIVAKNPVVLSPYLKNFNGWRPYVIVSSIEAALSIVNYVYGPITHPYASSWYLWPTMQTPVLYYSFITGAKIHEIGLYGNPVIWFSGTLSAILAIAISHRFLRKKFAVEYGPKRKTFLLLLGGYISALLPFATYVNRTTFLYHYFPALLFSIGLLTWSLSEKFHFDNFDTLTKKQSIALCLIIIFFAVGFLINARFVYGW